MFASPNESSICRVLISTIRIPPDLIGSADMDDRAILMIFTECGRSTTVMPESTGGEFRSVTIMNMVATNPAHMTNPTPERRTRRF